LYKWDFTPVLANAPLLAQGLLNTLKITGTALVCGLVLGLALALLRLSPRQWLAWPAGFIIEVFRTTPPLVQLFWFFFALPLIVGVEMTAFMAAAVTFSIQSAAFFAEVFRGGIVSIERGQWDGARQRLEPPPGAPPDHPAAGGQAHDSAFMERAIEADEDHDSGRHHRLCRSSVCRQRSRKRPSGRSRPSRWRP
jgi:His/Glu/Gln/Arg/opine family amino acid ABC transporter permease subunit